MTFPQLFEHPPVFETPRLILRRLHMEDAEDYFAMASNPLVSKHTVWDTHQSVQDSIAYLSMLQKKMDSNQCFHWGMIDKESHRWIGRVGWIHLEPFHGLAEVGFALHCGWWGQGIMSEAAGAVIRYGFEDLDLNRIEGRCNVGNGGSERVLQKLGMSFEGILRKQLRIKGHHTDQKMYAILKSDFQNQQEA